MKTSKEEFPLSAQYTLLNAIHEHLQQEEYASAALLGRTTMDLHKTFAWDPYVTETVKTVTESLEKQSFTFAEIKVAPLHQTLDQLYDEWVKGHTEILSQELTQAGLTEAEKAEWRKRFGVDGSSKMKVLSKANPSAQELGFVKVIHERVTRDKMKTVKTYLSSGKIQMVADLIGLPFELLQKIWKFVGTFALLNLIQRAMLYDYSEWVFYVMLITNLHVLLCIVIHLFGANGAAVMASLGMLGLLKSLLVPMLISVMFKYGLQLFETLVGGLFSEEAKEGASIAYRLYLNFKFIMSFPSFIAYMVGGLSTMFTFDCIRILTQDRDWWNMIRAFMYKTCTFAASYFESTFSVDPAVVCAFLHADVDPWSILGVPKGSSMEDVTKAYEKLGAQYNPDLNKGVDPSIWTKITNAYKKIQEDNKPP